MAKWKLFGKSKEETTVETEEKTQETQEEIAEDSKDTEGRPIAEYRETLESGKKSSSKTTTVTKRSETPSDQRVWRDVDAIEENIDNIHVRKAEKPVTEVDKKVDKLIQKNKRK